MDDGNTRAAALKTIDPAMDFGNGVSLTALTTAIRPHTPKCTSPFPSARRATSGICRCLTEL